MRKTIDLTDENIKAVNEWQKRNGLKNFSESVRNIISNIGLISNIGQCSCEKDLEKIKIDVLNTHVAPNSAGEV